jgi:tetratricopeptide (TPR) repeat protein
LLEERPDWGSTVRLDPLPDDAADRLLAGFLAGARVPEEVRIRVADTARGNPLFIEELAAMLVDEGVLVRKDGSWEATRELASLAVPASVSALLGARLDRLDAESRHLLERGAVEGEVFHRGAVIELSPGNERQEISRGLQRLAEREFVSPAQAAFRGDAAFRFRHILLREAAYRGTAKRVRAELHERFAEWLERVAGERMVEYEEIAGYHFEQSYRLRIELGRPDEEARSAAERAAVRLADAGRRAFARGDYGAVNNLLGRSLELADTLSTDVAVDLADARLGFGDFDGLERIVDLLAEDGRPEARAYADLYRSHLELQRDPEGAGDRATARVKSILKTFETLGDERGLAKTWALRATVHMAHGELAAMRQAAEHCRRHASLAGDARQEAEGHKLIGASMLYGEAPASEVAKLFAEQLAWAEERMDLATEAEVTVALAVLHANQGDFPTARDVAQRGEILLVELGAHIHHAAFTGSAQIEFAAGDYAEAERLSRDAYDTLEKAGEKGYLSTLAVSLARMLLEQGRLDEAWQFAERSRELGGSDDVVTQSGWRLVEARILAERGQPKDAERLAREGVGVIEATEYLSNRAQALFDLGEVLDRAGRHGDAAEAFTQALDLWERKEGIVMAERARARLTEVQSLGASSR